MDRLTDAIAAFNKALSLKSNYYSAHFALGQIYLGQENFSKAASAFKAAMRSNPKKPKAAYNYAVAVESQDPENMEANIANWDKYIQLAKKDAKERNSLGVAQGHVKALQEALDKKKYE
jgi:tetratricopeptide (TPR) repeat protein